VPVLFHFGDPPGSTRLGCFLSMKCTRLFLSISSLFSPSHAAISVLSIWSLFAHRPLFNFGTCYLLRFSGSSSAVLRSPSLSVVRSLHVFLTSSLASKRPPRGVLRLFLPGPRKLSFRPRCSFMSLPFQSSPRTFPDKITPLRLSLPPSDLLGNSPAGETGADCLNSSRIVFDSSFS